MSKQCVAWVTDAFTYRQRHCANKAMRDELCGVHHPDNVAKRVAKQAAKYAEERKKSPYYRLEKANEKIAELTAANKLTVAGWRACVDHIIKPEHKCPVCQIEKLEAQVDALDEPVNRLVSWCRAYPPDIFIETTPLNWKKANIVLANAGISMTGMNASNMRHVVAGVTEIANELEAIVQERGGD